MVTTIVNEIKRVIKEYIKRYNQCQNVEKELYSICDANDVNWKQSDNKMSKEDKSFLENTYKKLVKENKKRSKPISKSLTSIDVQFSS